MPSTVQYSQARKFGYGYIYREVATRTLSILVLVLEGRKLDNIFLDAAMIRAVRTVQKQRERENFLQIRYVEV